MSLYSSLYTSYSGINVSQSSLTVTTNNLMNVSTTGYTRRQAISTSVYTSSQTGGGVKIENVRQISDQFLRQNCRESDSELSYWMSKHNYLSEIEHAYGSFEDYNLQSSVTDFFNAWDELYKNPTDAAARSMVYSVGVNLTEIMNQYDNQLNDIKSSVINDVIGSVNAINNLTVEIAALNEAVLTYPKDQVPLELIDQREHSIDQLSAYIDCTAVYQADGSIDVVSESGLLVYGKSSETIDYKLTPPDGIPEVIWSNGSSFKCGSGSLSALTELLDNSHSPCIDEFSQTLNDGLMTIVNEVNNLFTQGYDLNGNQGVAYFVPINANEPMSLSNIKVNEQLLDSNYIVASESGENGDGNIALSIAELDTIELIAYEEEIVNIYDYLSAYTGWLGGQVQHASLQETYQENYNLELKNQLSVVSGVSEDEEMTNMIMYQQMYNANINVMKTIDDLIGNLIQELG